MGISHKPIVKGKLQDDEGRCIHWNTKLDIVSIKFYCCDTYYPCYKCHEETADHYVKTWPETERDRIAVLCGVCSHEMSINQYLNSRDECPNCAAAFNPNCRHHWAMYFDIC